MDKFPWCARSVTMQAWKLAQPISAQIEHTLLKRLLLHISEHYIWLSLTLNWVQRPSACSAAAVQFPCCISRLHSYSPPPPTHHPLPASSFAQLQLSFMEVTNPLVVTHLGRHPPALQLEKHPRHVHRQQKCTPVSHELIRGCTRAHWPHIYAHCTWPGCICDW